MGAEACSRALARAHAVTVVLSLTAAALLVLCAHAASATTLGSTLQDPYEATFGGTAGLTVYQAAAPAETLTAPADGTITSWSVRSGEQSAKYELRILRPAGSSYIATGTSSVQTVPDGEDKVRGPFAVNLHVKAGDRLALDVLSGEGAPINNLAAPAADELNYVSDPFGEGETREPVLVPPLGGSQELLLQASFTPGEVEVPPPPPPPPPPPKPVPPIPSLGTKTVNGRLAFLGSGSSGGSSTISGYNLRLETNVGTSTLECGPSKPTVIPVFSSAVHGTATLTVDTAAGQSASTQMPFSAAGVAPLHHGVKLARAAGLVLPGVIAYQCLSASESAVGGSFEEGTGPGVKISSACEMVAGIMHVEGCGLKRVEDICSEVPEPERGIVIGHLLPSNSLSLAACGGTSRLISAGAARARAAGQTLQSVPAADQRLASFVDQFYVSTEPIRVNGIDVIPRPGKAVVIAVGGLLASTFAKQYGVYLISGEATESLGGFALQKGKLDLDVSNLGAAEAKFAAFNIQNPITFGRFSKLAVGAVFAQLGGVPSLPLTGGFEAIFVKGGATKLNINLEISKLFNNPLNDLPFTGSTTLLAENGRGLVLDKLDINVPDLDLQIIDLSNIKLDWDRATDAISGQIAVDSDELGGAIGGTLAFQGGNFVSGSVFYQADEISNKGGGGYLITPPIWLINLSAGFSLFEKNVPGSTTAFDGQATLSVGPALSNNGCGLLQANGDFHMQFYPGPFAVSVTGVDEILCIPLQRSYFSANADGYVKVGGGYELDVPEVFDINTNLDGQAYVDINNPLASHFQLDGSASATLHLPDPIGNVTLGGEAVISDLGAGICTDVSVLGHHFHPGVTESFRPTPPLTPVQFLAQLSLAGDGCSLSPYQPLGVGGAASASARAHASFTVPAGQTSTSIVLHGQGGAPAATLTGPGGQKIDTSQVGAGSDYLVLRQASTGTTLVMIDGSAGSWSVSADPGSVPLLSAAVAHELPKPKIAARVSGRGARRELHYEVGAQPGLSVSFVESGGGGAQRLATVKGGSGSVAFVPAGGSTGVRTIAAVLTQNGLPRPGFVVARYSAGPPRPGRVRSIRVRRAGAGLLVSFAPAPLAKRYLATVSFSNGSILVAPSRRGAHSVLVPSIPAGAAITRVGVQALRGELHGPLTLARLPGKKRRHH